MSTIRCVYEKAPGFPATDQHPAAVRYPINAGPFKFADVIGGPPSQAEIDALLGTDAAGVTEAQRKTDIDATIAGDATIQLLKGMTNAEFAAWWGANVTNLAQAGGVLMRVTRLVIRKLT